MEVQTTTTTTAALTATTTTLPLKMGLPKCAPQWTNESHLSDMLPSFQINFHLIGNYFEKVPHATELTKYS